MMQAMNRTYFRMASVLAAAFLFSACTQDELTNSTDTLPEGMYPLQISGITLEAESSQQPWGADAPQTRVAENPDGNGSVWQDGDKINVQIGDGTPGVYTYTDGKLEVADGDAPAYWASTDNGQTITAWYTSLDTETVDLSNQANGLAYVLKAQTTADFNESVSLSFSHALAKVRVVFSEESTADLTNASVSVLALTSCTVDKGNVAAGGTTNYIPMHKATYNDGKVCYEANVTPNLTLKDNAFQLTIDGKTVNCSTSEVLTQTGQLHVVTLTVNEKMTEVNVSEISGTEYTVSGNVHLKGNGQSKDLKLTMEAGSRLTIENVKLTPTTNGNAITCKGDATITLRGENTLSGKYTGTDNGYSAILVESGTLTISGENNDKLTATGVGCIAGGAGIGAINGAHIIIEGGNIIAKGGDEAAGIGSAGFGKNGGDITIKGGIIEATGGKYSAGIGGSNSGTCGDIIITGGNIKAYGGLQSPGIGCGDAGACKNITISGGTIVATKGFNSPSSIGACLATSPTGTVTIDRNNADVTEN